MTRRSLLLLGAFASLVVRTFSQEAMLQYFNTSWKEIERRIPEVAEAGYTPLWLPQPAKGRSGAWAEITAVPIVATGANTSFTHAGGAAGVQRFYSVSIEP